MQTLIRTIGWLTLGLLGFGQAWADLTKSWYFSGPQSPTIAQDGSLWVADAFNCRILHFNVDGDLIAAIGGKGKGAGQFDEPEGVAAAPDGSVWVADTYNNRLQHFKADGTFIAEYGSEGAGAGQFKAPSAVAVSNDGSVWVADTQNHRLQHP